MLADLVKAGKLPPVDQRLPKNPMVMTGYEGIGKYGGTWRRAFQGVSDINGPTKVVDRAWALVRQEPELDPAPARIVERQPGRQSVDHQDARGTQVVGWQGRIHHR